MLVLALERLSSGCKHWNGCGVPLKSLTSWYDVTVGGGLASVVVFCVLPSLSLIWARLEWSLLDEAGPLRLLVAWFAHEDLLALVAGCAIGGVPGKSGSLCAALVVMRLLLLWWVFSRTLRKLWGDCAWWAAFSRPRGRSVLLVDRSSC